MVKRTYLHVAVVTMVTAVLWLIGTIYSTITTTSTSTKVDPTIMTPIKPSFDEEVFRLIVERENLSKLSFDPAKTEVEEKVTINQIELGTQEASSVSEEQPSEPTVSDPNSTEITP